MLTEKLSRSAEWGGTASLNKLTNKVKKPRCNERLSALSAPAGASRPLLRTHNNIKRDLRPYSGEVVAFNFVPYLMPSL